ncbi:hypothetical protein BKA67DRAFT_551384 [Truncatella angustata]|uniref:Uncharacterized protein n=1 Tax=Truncatella angustata TaxID=152316 RepID=A0A9P8ZZQ0_9PEZI|nr:uncharacterized protein BKA67DRAFT_551384 [Truncatella angustata]KAH6656254.1 hypothetical protein BKA67DRAFT_551384 [Truncatella angustata]
MSASSPILQSPAEEITHLVSEPFTPKPLIADLIRTRYCIPGSVFLVEGIDIFQASRSRRWRGVRLLLGDGELCIQALLAGEMHRYVDRGDVAVGSYVKLESFDLAHIEPEASKAGKNVEKAIDAGASMFAYLMVEDLVIVGWNNRLLAMLDAEKSANPEQHVLMQTQELKDKDIEEPEIRPEPQEAAADSPHPHAGFLEEVADADDDFEVMNIPEQKMTQKREEIAAQTEESSDYSVPLDTQRLPWSNVDPRKPLKLTPLRSIPNLPYKQNWSTNVLAVIASISDLQASTLPLGNQRVARLAHPSTPKQVHLTIFLDAHEFTPSVGSVVLLLGVKNHRFDGGSLKKYASDRPGGGGRWWFENPVQFTWCDVQGLRTWWRQIHLK